MFVTSTFTIVSGPPSLPDAAAIAASGFGHPPGRASEPDFLADIEAHLGGDLCYSLLDAGTRQPFGFAVFNRWQEILYLAGIVLQADQQHHGVARHVLRTACRDAASSGPIAYLALRTTSPRMWSALHSVAEQTYPHPQDPSAAAGLASVAELVAARLGHDPLGTQPVVRNCYPDGLYGDEPLHHNNSIQQWWGALRAFPTDAVIVVARIGS